MTICPHCGQPIVQSGTKRYQVVPSGFDQFWSAYPHKIGKAAAQRAFESALKKTHGLTMILNGLEKYKASKPERYAWCNPATWLNQERWLDEPQHVKVEERPHNDSRVDPLEIHRVRIRNYLASGFWPAMAPPLEQTPWQILAEFSEQLKRMS